MKKKLVVKDRTQCQACLTCAVECSMAFYKKEGLGCIDITTKKDGSINVQACNQCGVCAKKCPEQAISQNAKGVYVIDKKKCTGCLTCVEACPRGIIVKAEDKETPSKCIACGKCAKACPMEILEVVEVED
ncbi:MAG: 4Fe-4S binding protein [Intestinibacter sp.]|uniref:4Fe-4S binding protein n=1 Tax=Intestinibacter sp. TaxID=1965304 RepID=UPI003F15CDA2